ncbi:MAG: dynamin family protein [Enhygromyxa sp.]
MLDDPSTATSPLAATAQLASTAAELAELAAALGHDDIATAVRDDAKRRLDDGRVRAVVLGEIKHGKSSLINALLRAQLLPVGVTPTTGAVVAIRVDPEAEADEGVARTGTFLVSAHGERVELERERFDLLARGKDQDQAGRTPELLVAEAQLPATLELIDTPGFNDIDRFRAAVSRSELPRADVLVLVLDATQVLSRSELGLIRDAIAAVGGLDGSGARCLLVINRIDLVPEDERPKIVEHLRAALETVLPGPLEPFLTDSKTALREPEADSEPVRAVARLREELFSLAGRGREILPARARAAMLRHAKLLGYNAAIQARALRLEQAEIEQEIAAVEQALAAQASDLASLRKTIAEADERIIAASVERLGGFRAELEEGARAQIHQADIHTLTQVVPGAIQDAFLDFVSHESERLRIELEQLTREVFATHGELARRRLFEATLPLGFRGPGVYVEPPALLIEVGMLALGLVGTIIWYFGNTMTGMIMTIASPLTTVVLREKTVRDARSQARAALPDALDRAIEQLRETVVEVVERHGAALDEHLMLADRALGEQLLDGLRRAEQRLREHEQRIAAMIARAQGSTQAEDQAPKSEAEPPSWTPEGEEGEEGEETQDAEAKPPTPDQASERLRERVHAAASAELGGLERRLEELVEQLSRMVLDEPGGEGEGPNGEPEPEIPPVIH